MVGMTDDSQYLSDSPPPQTRRSAETWAAARADYLAGGSAAEVCERHGLSQSTFRWRARTEGWRRSDQPHGAVFEPLDSYEMELIDSSLPCNAADMARLAWSNASRAMRDGKLIEARGWSRLHADLVEMARQDAERLHFARLKAERDQGAALKATPTPLRPVEED